MLNFSGYKSSRSQIVSPQIGNIEVEDFVQRGIVHTAETSTKSMPLSIRSGYGRLSVCVNQDVLVSSTLDNSVVNKSKFVNLLNAQLKTTYSESDISTVTLLDNYATKLNLTFLSRSEVFTSRVQYTKTLNSR